MKIFRTLIMFSSLALYSVALLVGTARAVSPGSLGVVSEETTLTIAAQAQDFNQKLLSAVGGDQDDLAGEVFMRIYNNTVYFARPSEGDYFIFPAADAGTMRRVEALDNYSLQGKGLLNRQQAQALNQVAPDVVAVHFSESPQSIDASVYKDKNKVYCALAATVVPVPGADTKTFQIVANSQNYIFKDKKNIYLYNKGAGTMQVIVGLDPRHFTILDSKTYGLLVFKDKKTVYSLVTEEGILKKVVGADAPSFKLQVYRYGYVAKDKYSVYTYVNSNIGFSKVPNISASQFRIVQISDSLYYGRDAKNFYYRGTDGQVKTVKNVDFATFKIIKAGPWFYYGKDKKNVWFYNGQLGLIKEISGADVKSFGSYQVDDHMHFLRDKKNVYYRNAQEDVVVLAGADPKTFEMKSVEWGMYIARDANHRWVYRVSDSDLGPAHSFIVLPSENNESFDALFK